MQARDRLAEYTAKRDFTKTGEPRGKRGKRKRANLGFFVQKHDARRLHYDLRLEWDGVLLSWAVTRGPSPDPGQKRLAVRTEDHPLSYAEFEGTIPQKEYGGGTVMLWDKGTWEPQDDDPGHALETGKLAFVARGTRMRGGWVLVRMRPRAREKRQNWLLIKTRDEHANDDAQALVRHYTTSIASQRTMKQIANGDSPRTRTKRKKRKTAARPKRKASRKGRLPPFMKPQLATLTGDVPEGADWIHESKFDGYRCLVAVGGGNVRCYTRSGRDWTDEFAEVAETLAELDCGSALIDGEAVASAGNGSSQFSALQSALSSGSGLGYFAFDLLHLDGDDLRRLPLVDRKVQLKRLLSSLKRDSIVRYSEHVRGSGAAVFEAACGSGSEGIVSKKADAPYSGRRTRTWLKIKCKNRQEFVIGGYSVSDKRGRPFSSLLMGTYEDGRLVYRGRVGTGFSTQDLTNIAAQLKPLRRDTSPFGRLSGAVSRDARWVSPKLVAEVDFAELTSGGHVRHGAFRGLRQDKKPTEVVMEKTADAPIQSKDGSAEFHGIRLTHPERIVFREQGVSKADLAGYYSAVAQRMLALMRDHPLSLVRCPKGAGDKCFFQKHASDGFPEALKRVPITESDGDVAEYLYVDGVEGLIAGVQMGTLEFHIWGSRIDRLEKPDRLVFDLDPDPELDFEVVRLAAAVVRDRLSDIGLQTLPLVTGGKGLHVVAPLRRTADWESVKSFARAFAEAAAARHPDVFVATMSKRQRRGKIFIDWLRNDRGATAVAPYSSRARQGAPVATPLNWKELADVEAADAFHLDDVIRRIGQPDPWAAYGKISQSVTRKMQERIG